MSGVASNRARIRSLWASMRPDLRSPPTDRARASPASRSSARQRLTLDALTPNRSPAWRWLNPRATAARTRTRRSNDKAVGMPAGLDPGQQLESRQTQFWNPSRFNQIGYRSRTARPSFRPSWAARLPDSKEPDVTAGLL